jgi:hypothetical protein
MMETCPRCDLDHLPEYHLITHVIIDGQVVPCRLQSCNLESVTVELEDGRLVTVPLDDYRPHHVEGA